MILNTDDFLNALSQHRGVCFLSSKGHEVSYEKLMQAIEWNALVFQKLGYGRSRAGQPMIAVNVLLGWRAVPILLAAFMQQITVVPVDPYRNPQLTYQIIGEIRSELILDRHHADMEGRLQQDLIPNIVPQSRMELGDVALILYTSGTTGFPKGVMLTYSNLWSNLSDILNYLAIGLMDRLLMVRPLTHASAITGELLPALYRGSSIVMKPNEATPLSAIREIDEQRISLVCTTPTVAAALAHFAAKFDVSSLRCVMLSGELLLKAPLAKIRQAFPHATIGNAYGLTEASPRISCLTHMRDSDALDCVGEPLSHVQVKIANASGEAVRDGSRGVLWVCGPNIMKGYYQDEQATERKLKDGWLLTSDLATLRGGELFIHGREDDVIIRGGVNIHPYEVESYLLEMDGISEALVFGRQEDHGMKMSAWVVAEPALERQEIYRCILRLQPDSRLWPDVIEIKSHLPKTPSGKLIRPKQ